MGARAVERPDKSVEYRGYCECGWVDHLAFNSPNSGLRHGLRLHSEWHRLFGGGDG